MTRNPIEASITIPSAQTTGFDYEQAFSRNLGWVTAEEQARLKNCRVAIGGLGGVGGSNAITLARLGVGRFTISDLDVFDWPNLNRQAGAFASTIGAPKLQTIADTLKDINPDIELRLIPGGIRSENLDEFLQDADLYVDSLDIFALDVRRAIFGRCRTLGIPAITAAPMGMGTAFLAFTRESMSFDDYFALEGFSFEEQVLRFIVGISPSMQQRHYLVDKGGFDLFTKKVPSTCIGIELAAGVLCANAVKFLLRRGDVIIAPRGLHFDAYRNGLVQTWRPWGNRNPLQRFMLWRVRSMFAKIRARATATRG